MNMFYNDYITPNCRRVKNTFKNAKISTPYSVRTSTFYQPLVDQIIYKYSELVT